MIPVLTGFGTWKCIVMHEELGIWEPSRELNVDMMRQIQTGIPIISVIHGITKSK